MMRNMMSMPLFEQRGPVMRTTLAIDDDLFERARASTGLTGTSAVVREALKALIERESARRLALLGGGAPDLQDIPRRRPGEA